MLFACKLFLRSDEHDDFTDAQFIRELTACDVSDQVTMLAVRIKGKTDSDEVALCIWNIPASDSTDDREVDLSEIPTGGPVPNNPPPTVLEDLGNSQTVVELDAWISQRSVKQ